MTMRYIIGRARTPWETRSRLMKDLRHHRDHGFGLCLGLHRDTGAVAGRFGIEPRETPHGLEGELAWMVAEEFRGSGLATEAGRALLAFATESLTLRRLFATTDPANTGSVRVMEKLGLIRTETRSDEWVYEARRPGE